ncbi:thiamine diphosphokinase [soil metagenome]
MEGQARVAIVVTGGEPVDPAIAAVLPFGAYVVAADSGLEQAARLGLRADLAVGDFDSVRPETLAAAAAGGCHLDRHPAAKDHTDLELGLLAAMSWGADRIVVVGGHGGRLDHLMANVLALAGPELADTPVEAWMGSARLDVASPTRRVVLGGRAGEVVTLLAVGGPARGVRTEGLRFPLVDEELQPGSTRGVSNKMIGDSATVAVGEGVVLVIRPTAGRVATTDSGAGGLRPAPGP